MLITALFDPTTQVPVACDAAGRLLIATAAAAPLDVRGPATPSDAYANPTAAVESWSLAGGWDATANRWARVRALPWASATGNETAQAYALATFGQICGPNGLGGITRMRVTSTGALIAGNSYGQTALADNINASGQSMEFGLTFPLVRTQSTLAAALTDNRSSQPNADVYGQLFVTRGRPALNARNQVQSHISSGVDNPVVNAPCVLRWMEVTNEAAAAIVYAQVHNVAVALAGGEVPLVSIPLGGTTVTGIPSSKIVNFDDYSAGGGLYLNVGCHIAYSSTFATYTAVGTAAKTNASFVQ
jgi:hypothetical protein